MFFGVIMVQRIVPNSFKVLIFFSKVSKIFLENLSLMILISLILIKKCVCYKRNFSEHLVKFYKYWWRVIFAKSQKPQQIVNIFLFCKNIILKQAEEINGPGDACIEKSLERSQKSQKTCF